MYMKKTHTYDYIHIFIEQKTLSALSESQWGMQNNLQSHATGIKFDSECITKHHSQCYSLLQLKTSGLKMKFLSITLEFAAELNVVRAPFLRHHYLLTSARQVERLPHQQQAQLYVALRCTHGSLNNCVLTFWKAHIILQWKCWHNRKHPKQWLVQGIEIHCLKFQHLVTHCYCSCLITLEWESVSGKLYFEKDPGLVLSCSPGPPVEFQI